MLKKAGIVVAAAAATLLAVSPLAFATENGGDDGDGHEGSNSQVNSNGDDRERSSSGLINIDALNGDNEVNVPIQACDNNVNVINLIPVSDLTGVVSLLNLGGTNSAQSTESCTQANNSGGTVDQKNG